MEKHAYHTLQILEQVEKSDVVTNRRVAGKLNVSVKLAHALMSQLIHKGLVHIIKHNSRQWDYILTPQGIAEKARLTYQFMDFTMQFYRDARRRSAEALALLRKQGVQRIAFLGRTELAEIAYLGVQDQKLTLVDVFDANHAGEEFMGIKVRPISEMEQTTAERVLVTAFDPALPMGERFVPSGLTAAGGARLAWIFGPREKP